MRRDDLDQVEKWAATSVTMAFALLLTLTLCGPAAVAQSAAFHANGAFASDFFGCSLTPTSIECPSVGVSSGTTNGQKTTFLFYDLSIFDLAGNILQDSFGFGQIPNSAFQVHGQADSLNVDTSTVPGFSNTICVFDSNGIPTCNPGPGGVVTGTWNVITNFKFRMTGTVSNIFPNMIFKSVGTTEDQSASASINVLGGMLAGLNGSAFVGTNHDTSISVSRH